MTPYPYLYRDPVAQTIMPDPYIYNLNQELFMSVLNKNRIIDDTLDNNEVRIKIETNDLVDESDLYLLQLKFKEQVLSSQSLMLKKSEIRDDLTLSIDKKKTDFLNGGLLTVNLYRQSSDVIIFFAGASPETYSSIRQDQVIQWLQPKGEILVIQKPSNTLDVEIKLDKQDMYAPGD